MNSKGTFNIEMFISLMVLIMIFSTIVSFSVEEFSSVEETQNRRMARTIVSDISRIIVDVYVKGDGFSRRYDMPPKINNETYVLQINSSGVYINSHYQIASSKIPSGVLPKSKRYTLKAGHVYEFLNKNNTIEVMENTWLNNHLIRLIIIKNHE